MKPACDIIDQIGVHHVLQLFKEKGTLLFVKIRYRSSVELGEYSGWSGTYPVYRFSSESTPTIGQVIPFVGTIILNKHRFDNLSEQSANLILEHEIGHAKRSLQTGISYWILIFLGIFGSWRLIPFPSNFHRFFSQIFPIELAIFLILVAVITIRLEELMAEIHALDTTTEEIFLETHREIAEQRPKD